MHSLSTFTTSLLKVSVNFASAASAAMVYSMYVLQCSAVNVRGRQITWHAHTSNTPPQFTIIVNFLCIRHCIAPLALLSREGLLCCSFASFACSCRAVMTGVRVEEMVIKASDQLGQFQQPLSQ